MLRSTLRHKKLTALLMCGILTLSYLAWNASAFVRGAMVAQYDIAHGHYRHLTYGLPIPWQPSYAQVLRQRYGIEMQAVAGCIVSRLLMAYVDGYNGVSTSAANRRWRRDVFKDSWKAAREIGAGTNRVR